MPSNNTNQPEKYIVPLNMNRLEGRMLRYPARNRHLEILLVGDMRARIEYWWGLVRLLHDYGSVTLTDLPGIGGMDSFYKIGKTPTIDAYADYLASFIKLRYKRRHIVIVGVGFGFVIVTRMLQKYPDMAERVNLLVSLGGYTDYDDFKLPRHRRYLAVYASALVSRRTLALVVKPLFREPVLVWFYSRRLKRAPTADQLKRLNTDVERWLSSDLRTTAALTRQLGWFSNTDRRIDLPLVHVKVPGAQLSYPKVEQRLKVIYADLKSYPTRRVNRYLLQPDKRSAAVYLPAPLKRRLKSL